VPAAFWTRGWISYLDTPAITMLLILLAKGHSKRQTGIWISPSQLDQWYDISDDHRRRGVKTLENAGLLCVTRAPVNPNYERRQVRNIYAIEPNKIGLPIDPYAKKTWAPVTAIFDENPLAAWSEFVRGRLEPAAETKD
jgi:hypothetical protein